MSGDLRAEFLRTGRDADMPIVDAHHHFWDIERNNHPWLRERPLISFRYGDYSEICRNFLPDDYFRHAAGHRVVKTVYMEAEWAAERSAGRAALGGGGRPRHRVPERDGRPGVARPRGHRRGPAWPRRFRDGAERAPQAPLGAAARGLPRPLRRAGVDALPALARRLREARAPRADVRAAGAVVALRRSARLARDFPATTLIVNHTGLPADRSVEGPAPRGEPSSVSPSRRTCISRSPASACGTSRGPSLRTGP